MTSMLHYIISKHTGSDCLIRAQVSHAENHRLRALFFLLEMLLCHERLQAECGFNEGLYIDFIKYFMLEGVVHLEFKPISWLFGRTVPLLGNKVRYSYVRILPP